ncbi:MAG: serine hydrolase [Verrucomicrobia bacterium]|nr:serine hydrolase [Verrucomicrobiota bacterium]MDA1067692.1 serine hydrolase [Verrucomicrobiota bacterium]
MATVVLFGSSYRLTANPGDQAVALVNDWMAETQTVGITVSVGVKGEIVWSQGFGYSDLEQQVPVYPDRTRFRVGSVAKPMTATAIGLLYEQGKLDLDAPVQTYVPSFPEKQGIVTTRLLAGHLAGIRHYKGNEVQNSKRYESVLEALSIFKDDPLIHAPGLGYSYSSYGFNLLSAVIERASGQNYLEYMDDHVFGPMGMDHTEADQVYSIIPNRGRYYAIYGDQLNNAPAVDNSYKWAGGGFISTSDDLVRFGFAYLGNEILKAETIKLLWTSQKSSAGEVIDYGIGWRSGIDDAGRSWIGHNGGSVGGSTIFKIYPGEGVVIALISNLSNQKWNDLEENITALFLE